MTTGLTVCRSVLRCVAVCCSVLQCVAVCSSVLQCVAVCSSAKLWGGYSRGVTTACIYRPTLGRNSHKATLLPFTRWNFLMKQYIFWQKSGAFFPLDVFFQIGHLFWNKTSVFASVLCKIGRIISEGMSHLESDVWSEADMSDLTQTVLIWIRQVWSEENMSDQKKMCIIGRRQVWSKEEKCLIRRSNVWSEENMFDLKMTCLIGRRQVLSEWDMSHLKKACRM